MKASLVTLATLVIWGNFSYSAVNMADIPVASGFYPPIGDRNANVSSDLRWGDHGGCSTWLFPNWYSATNFNTQKDYRGEWYSENPPYSYHPGEDWNGNGGGNSDLGQPVYSISSGRVLFTGTGFGNTVVVIHKLSSRELVASLYAHLDSISVSQNQEVTRSSQIGTVGNSGTVTAHLHFEIRRESMLDKDSSGNISLRYPANHWPGTDTAFISSNYFSPSDFILSHQSSDSTSNVGKYADGSTNQPILTCYNNLPSYINKGSPIDNNGGGIYVHDWNGVTIQDFGNSGYKTDGMYAIVYNGNMNQAFQIKEGFWGVYKPAPVYYCPMNAICNISGPDNLGAPRNGEHDVGFFYSVMEQEFEKGYLRWNSYLQKLYLKWKGTNAVSPAKNNEWYRLFAPWETSDEHARVSRTLLYELNSEIKILPAKKTGRNSVHLLSEGKIILSWQIESPPTGGTTFLSYSTNGIDFSFLYLYH